MRSPYLVSVAKLLRDVPSTLEVRFEAPFDESHEFLPRGPAETDVFPEASVKVEVRLESFSGGLRARGCVEAPWHGVCRRCSTPVLGVSSVKVDERYVDDLSTADDEAYLIENNEVDLAPLAHDAILLELPLAPLCREDCKGLCPQCGTDWNEGQCRCLAPIDPRWATLDGLQLSDPEFDV
ncbi:MAG TPA: YceD family protein [Acidimicrobiales bacterium]|nr:YceD family protein [Acidimicrobiales bacterium]